MLLQQIGPAVWLEFDCLKEKTVPVILRSSVKALLQTIENRVKCVMCVG